MTTPSDITPGASAWTRGRVAALLAIAVVFAGLSLAARGRHPEQVAVPDGARAGQLTLAPCTYPTEQGDLRADCGTLVVPERRSDPRSRLIALPVTRIRSRSAGPAEPVFRLEGGPGRTNMTFPYASRYLDRHDVVLVGYRGVDGSARLDCPEVVSARRHAADLVAAAALRESARALRSCAARLRGDGFDLAGYTLPERVDDLEAARRALGYDRVDLLSESFGTRVALIYAWRHPASIRRSIMVGVNPPGHFVWRPQQTDIQLRRFAELCGTACDARGADLVASMRKTAADLPRRWGPLRIKPGNARVAAFFGLMDASPDAGPMSAPMTLDAWRSAAKGDASGLWFESLAADLFLPRAQVWGDSAAMGRIDAGAARFDRAAGRGSVLGDDAGRFLWAGGGMAAAWPAAPGEGRYARMRDSAVPTLLVGGELDGSTPAANATRELLPHLSQGHQVILRGFGHTTDFWNRQAAAGTHLIRTYLDSGRVDASRYVPERVDFTPGLRQTTLAKAVVGVMLALGLLVGLSLAGMALRVRSRGALGRRTGVAVRSAWAVVAGIGGWGIGALVALSVLPSVPVDGTLVLGSGIGVPVALTTFLGWVRPAAGRAGGLAAAIGGALAGAWIGAACGEGALAPVTAVAGAVAGANLALVLRDVAVEMRAAREPGVPAPGPAGAGAAAPVHAGAAR